VRGVDPGDHGHCDPGFTASVSWLKRSYRLSKSSQSEEYMIAISP